MDNIFSGLLGAIITASVALIIAFKNELLLILKINKGRFNGFWSGTGEDIEVHDFIAYKHKIKYNIECDFKQYGNSVKGDILVKTDMTNKLCFNAKVFDGVYLVGQYNSTKHLFRDKGFVVAEINAKGNNIKGFFGGLRLREHGIVIAKFEMELL